LANVLRYVNGPAARRLTPSRALFLATAGAKAPTLLNLAKLDAGLLQAIGIAVAAAARVPFPIEVVPSLRDRIRAGRRALLLARTSARRAELEALRADVIALQDELQAGDP